MLGLTTTALDREIFYIGSIVDRDGSGVGIDLLALITSHNR